MKKKWLLGVLAIAMTAATAFGVSACGDKGGNDNGSSSGSSNSSEISCPLEDKIFFKTLTVDGTKVYGTVSNATEEFSFIDEIATQGNAKFEISMDKYGMQTVLTKTIPLSSGDNTVYVFEMIDDEITATYMVTIRRRPMYNVTFNTNGGTTVESQKIEESFLAIEPIADPTRVGYTFAGWAYDFTQVITQDTTIKANWTANTDTTYTVNYYLQNLDDDGYTLQETVELTGTTDTLATAEIKTYEHFTYNASMSNISGNIDGDGSRALNVYYILKEDLRDFYITFTAAGLEITGVKDWTASKIIIPDSVTSIGDYAFGVCESLTEIVIPDSVTSIGEGAFSYCISLTEIVIPDSVTSIGDYLFYCCKNLTQIAVGQNNTEYKSIDGNLYSKDGKTLIQYAMGKTATSFTISDGITTIEDGAFSGCESLTKIVIPDSVTSIGDRAFEDCDNLTIYCEVESQLSGWDSDWNYSNRPVVWGYTTEE